MATVKLTETYIGYLSIGGFDDDVILVKGAGVNAPGTHPPAFQISGARNHLTVNGFIREVSGTAIAVLTEGNDIAIGHSGEVVGSVKGITTSFALAVVNKGSITSEDAQHHLGTAFSGSAQGDVFVNSGHIVGDILLGGGNDRFEFDGGSINGEIRGGTGDDTLITYNGAIKLVEGAHGGTDTVISAADYVLSVNVEGLLLGGNKNIDGTGNATFNVLIGNDGKNLLSGLQGADTLDGGRGNDRLTGGNGADTFRFGTGYGKDEITDFHDVDHIDIAQWNAIGNFAAVKSHASDHGANVWITAGQDTLVIDHMHKADLHAGDFQF